MQPRIEDGRVPERSTMLGRALVDLYLERQGSIVQRDESLLEPRPVVTLSYALGIPGREIAQRLAAELNFTVFDQEVLDAIEHDTHLGKEIVGALDEGKRSLLDAWTEGLVHIDQRVIGPRSFHYMVSRIIRGIWLHGNAVILGRGANFILTDTDAFKVHLVAGRALRIRALADGMEGLGPMSMGDAEKTAVEHDASRTKFIRANFKADINDPLAYDTVFNLRVLDPVLAAQQVLSIYWLLARRKAPIRDEPLRSTESNPG